MILHKRLMTSCCLVEHFNISGSECVGSSIKRTQIRFIWSVPRGEGVGIATVGVGKAGACSVVFYAQVGPFTTTEGWSVSGTYVNSGTVFLWLDVQLDRSVAIDVI